MLTDRRTPFSGDDDPPRGCDEEVGVVWRAGRFGVEALWLEVKDELGLINRDGVLSPVAGADVACGEKRDVIEVLEGARIFETGSSGRGDAGGGDASVAVEPIVCDCSIEDHERSLPRRSRVPRQHLKHHNILLDLWRRSPMLCCFSEPCLRNGEEEELLFDVASQGSFPAPSCPGRADLLCGC